MDEATRQTSEEHYVNDASTMVLYWLVCVQYVDIKCNAAYKTLNTTRCIRWFVGESRVANRRTRVSVQSSLEMTGWLWWPIHQKTFWKSDYFVSPWHITHCTSPPPHLCTKRPITFPLFTAPQPHHSQYVRTCMSDWFLWGKVILNSCW